MRLEEIYEEDCTITERELFEMARVREADSGIPAEIYVSTKLAVRGRHGPRIKVSNIKNTFSDVDNFAIEISKNPTLKAGKSKLKLSVFGDIVDWVKLNYEPLIKYWNNEYKSDRDFYSDILPIR